MSRDTPERHDDTIGCARYPCSDVFPSYLQIHAGDGFTVLKPWPGAHPSLETTVMPRLESCNK